MIRGCVWWCIVIPLDLSDMQRWRIHSPAHRSDRRRFQLASSLSVAINDRLPKQNLLGEFITSKKNQRYKQTIEQPNNLTNKKKRWSLYVAQMAGARKSAEDIEYGAKLHWKKNHWGDAEKSWEREPTVPNVLLCSHTLVLWLHWEREQQSSWCKARAPDGKQRLQPTLPLVLCSLGICNTEYGARLYYWKKKHWGNAEYLSKHGACAWAQWRSALVSWRTEAGMLLHLSTIFNPGLGIHLCNIALNSYSASSISPPELIRRFLAILNDASVDDDIPGIPRRLHHGSIFYLLHLAQPPSFEFATRRPLNMVATSHRARDIFNVFIARSPQTKSRWSTNLNWQLWPFLVDQNQSRNLTEKLNLPKYSQLDDTAYLA